MERIGCAVIGAGVVGLAVARALALAGREVLILEAADDFGTGISARNSEVIHAGLYYPQGSLKAACCADGRRALYAYCESHGIPHRRCGKLIVAATEDQCGELEGIAARGRANGADNLRLLTAAAAKALEPELECVAALLSPDTGIVDSHGLMLALLGDAESHGAVLALRSPVRGGEATGSGFVLDVGGDAPMQLAADVVVNCAGLGAHAVAGALRGLAPEHVPPLHLAKGNYFTLAGRAPFSRLVYPIPEPGGLGVHLTLDLGGQARFGPDVEWIAEEDYRVDPARGEAFYGAIRRYWPRLPDGALQPGYAGIRPKLGGPGSAAADFRIDGPVQHGVAGLVNLFGIESPGLTSALALAARVGAVLEAGPR